MILKSTLKIFHGDVDKLFGQLIYLTNCQREKVYTKRLKQNL